MPIQQVLSASGVAGPAPVEVELDGSEGVGQPPEPQGRRQRQHGCGTGGQRGWDSGDSPAPRPALTGVAVVGEGQAGALGALVALGLQRRQGRVRLCPRRGDVDG